MLTSDELSARLGVTPEWIVASSGIRERRIAEAFETTAVMGARAAEDCLARANFPKESIGLLLVSSASSERRFPGPAAEMGSLLGLAGVPALDLPIASAGSLVALSLATDLAPRYGPVLIAATERMSGPALTEPLTKEVTPLFGDGAGACLVLPSSPGLQMRDHVLHSDGAYAAALALDFQGPVRMNGLTVILQAARKIPTVMDEVLARNSVSPDSVTAFLMHQANQNLIDRVARSLGVPATRFPSNIASYGNTSSASMLIAASEYFESAPARPGETYCFAAFGAGFHWGALLVTEGAA